MKDKRGNMLYLRRLLMIRLIWIPIIPRMQKEVKIEVRHQGHLVERKGQGRRTDRKRYHQEREKGRETETEGLVQRRGHLEVATPAGLVVIVTIGIKGRTGQGHESDILTDILTAINTSDTGHHQKIEAVDHQNIHVQDPETRKVNLKTNGPDLQKNIPNHLIKKLCRR